MTPLAWSMVKSPALTAHTPPSPHTRYQLVRHHCAVARPSVSVLVPAPTVDASRAVEEQRREVQEVGVREQVREAGRGAVQREVDDVGQVVEVSRQAVVPGDRTRGECVAHGSLRDTLTLVTAPPS